MYNQNNFNSQFLQSTASNINYSCNQINNNNYFNNESYQQIQPYYENYTNYKNVDYNYNQCAYNNDKNNHGSYNFNNQQSPISAVATATDCIYTSTPIIESTDNVWNQNISNNYNYPNTYNSVTNLKTDEQLKQWDTNTVNKKRKRSGMKSSEKEEQESSSKKSSKRRTVAIEGGEVS